jgi:hypothetical protein
MQTGASGQFLLRDAEAVTPESDRRAELLFYVNFSHRFSPISHDNIKWDNRL